MLRAPLCVDGSDDALAAEFLRRFGDELRPGHGGGIDRDLVGPRQQQGADVFQFAHAAAHGQRHEADFRRAPHHIQDGATIFMGGRDVEKAEFIGPGGVIDDRLLHRITGIAQAFEIDALDNAAILHVEAGNDADLKHDCFLS